MKTLIISATVIILLTAYSVAIWQVSASLKDTEYSKTLRKADEKYRRLEKSSQTKITNIADKWHRDALTRSRQNDRKDKKIAEILRVRNSRLQTTSGCPERSRDPKPDYIIERVYQLAARDSGLPANNRTFRLDGLSTCPALVRGSTRREILAKQQLTACLDIVRSAPCVVIR